jgi:DNA-directed RNA polymerase subunit RPC12/RpoP
MKEERMWTYEAGADYTCPYCDEPLYFNSETKDIFLDIDKVWVDWNTHCTECGRKFIAREVYKLEYTRIFEID